MIKRRVLFLVLPFLLGSCSPSLGEYRRYYGNMALTSFSLPYESIDGKAILTDDFRFRLLEEREEAEENPEVVPSSEKLLEEIFFADIFVLSNQEDVDTFFAMEDLTFEEEDKEKYSLLPEGIFYVLLISQIPEGYMAYKRNNIQGVDEEGNAVIISDNFYAYANRTDIHYFFIDLERDLQADYHVQSFLFEVSMDRIEEFQGETIRPIYAVE